MLKQTKYCLKQLIMMETKHDPHQWYANRIFSEILTDEIDIIKLREIVLYYQNKDITTEHLEALVSKFVEYEYYRAASQIQKIIKKNRQ